MTLWLIPARMGSKGIPQKNVKVLGGHPLLAYRAASVLSFAPAENVWISTDSEEFAEIAKKYGVSAPFIRPPELANDKALTADVVLHAMSFAKEHGRTFDAIGVLEPTSPFVLPKTLIDAEKKLMSSRDATAIVATRQVRPSHFFVQQNAEYLSQVSKNIREHGALRRQDEEIDITPSGGFYISKWDAFLKERSFYSPKTLSYLVSDLEGLEIDEPIDWDWAEFVMQKGLRTPKELGLR